MLFKEQHTFEKRSSEAARILKKYPNRVPIIVDIAESDAEILSIDKRKYLVPNDLTVGQFLFVVRKRIKLASETALFMFFNESLPSTSGLISTLYKTHQDDDGFLYATISLESTFG